MNQTQTYLEPEWREKRCVAALFPAVRDIAQMETDEASRVVKQNKIHTETNLSKLFDAYWWCVYSLLYSDNDDRTNVFDDTTHDAYFYDEECFMNDVDNILNTEVIRIETNTHNYPVFKKKCGGKTTASKKRVKDYKDFITTAIVWMRNNGSLDCDNDNDNDDKNGNKMVCSETYKINVDMIRSSQEGLLGNNPDSVAKLRKQQYNAICNFLDDVFVYRGYSRKIIEEGAELFTPEQLEEYQTCQTRIAQHCSDNNNLVPGFIRVLSGNEDFMLRPLSMS